jgi:tetratricopeptide (TPR) repeat protein
MKLLSLTAVFLIVGSVQGWAAEKSARSGASTTRKTDPQAPALRPPSPNADPAPATAPANSTLATQLSPADPSKSGQLPAYTSALSERAANAFTVKNWDEARKAYLEILKESPNNALTLSNLGSVEQGAGRLNEAKNYYTRALALNPGLTHIWTALGVVCYQTGDSYLGVSALTRAVHEDPTDAKAHNFLAVVAKKLGWLDAAEAELRRAIELQPDYANAHFNLALMYLERKPPAIELAKRHYGRAVALGAAKDEDVEERLKEK